jgi:hypothetical protein
MSAPLATVADAIRSAPYTAEEWLSTIVANLQQANRPLGVPESVFNRIITVARKALAANDPSLPVRAQKVAERLEKHDASREVYASILAHLEVIPSDSPLSRAYCALLVGVDSVLPTGDRPAPLVTGTFVASPRRPKKV